MKRALALLFVLFFIFSVCFTSVSAVENDEGTLSKISPDLRDNAGVKGQETYSVIIECDNPKTLSEKIEPTHILLNAVSAEMTYQEIYTLVKENFDEIIYVRPQKMFFSERNSSMPIINATGLWSSGYNGTNFTIAVIDSGVDDGHVELVRSVIYNNTFCTIQSDYCQDAKDYCGHGTHVAGIIAGNGSATMTNGRGAAYGASIYSYKAMIPYYYYGWKCGGQEADIAAAILDAVNKSVSIISLSLGGDEGRCNDTVVSAVEYAIERGIIVVASAGNSGPAASSISSPACAKGVIAVGATDDNDTIASFSSHGPTWDNRKKPDVVAPGVSITSTYSQYAQDGSQNSYATMSGTSMAVSHVTGIIANLMQWWNVTRGLMPSPMQVKAWILADSTALDAQSNARDNIYGSGRLYAGTGYIVNDTMLSGEKYKHNVHVSGLSKLKVSLVWYDSRLYSDNLNLELVRPNGTSAGTSNNVNDTVEEIIIPNPENGVWYAYVNATSVSNSQDYVLGSNALLENVTYNVTILSPTSSQSINSNAWFNVSVEDYNQQKKQVSNITANLTWGTSFLNLTMVYESTSGRHYNKTNLTSVAVYTFKVNVTNGSRSGYSEKEFDVENVIKMLIDVSPTTNIKRGKNITIYATPRNETSGGYYNNSLDEIYVNITLVNGTIIYSNLNLADSFDNSSVNGTYGANYTVGVNNATGTWKLTFFAKNGSVTKINYTTIVTNNSIDVTLIEPYMYQEISRMLSLNGTFGNVSAANINVSMVNLTHSVLFNSTPVINSTLSNYSVKINLANVSAGLYYVSARINDTSQNSGYSSNVTVAVTANVSNITILNLDASYYLGETIPITVWTRDSFGNASIGTSVTINVTNINGRNVTINTGQTNGTGHYVYNWTATGLPGGRYWLNITTEDVFGNTANNSGNVQNFTIEAFRIIVNVNKNNVSYYPNSFKANPGSSINISGNVTDMYSNATLGLNVSAYFNPFNPELPYFDIINSTVSIVSTGFYNVSRNVPSQTGLYEIVVNVSNATSRGENRTLYLLVGMGITRNFVNDVNYSTWYATRYKNFTLNGTAYYGDNTSYPANSSNVSIKIFNNTLVYYSSNISVLANGSWYHEINATFSSGNYSINVSVADNNSIYGNATKINVTVKEPHIVLIDANDYYNATTAYSVDINSTYVIDGTVNDSSRNPVNGSRILINNIQSQTDPCLSTNQSFSCTITSFGGVVGRNRTLTIIARDGDGIYGANSTVLWVRDIFITMTYNATWIYSNSSLYITGAVNFTNEGRAVPNSTSVSISSNCSGTFYSPRATETASGTTYDGQYNFTFIPTKNTASQMCSFAVSSTSSSVTGTNTTIRPINGSVSPTTTTAAAADDTSSFSTPSTQETVTPTYVSSLGIISYPNNITAYLGETNTSNVRVNNTGNTTLVAMLKTTSTSGESWLVNSWTQEKTLLSTSLATFTVNITVPKTATLGTHSANWVVYNKTGDVSTSKAFNFTVLATEEKKSEIWDTYWNYTWIIGNLSVKINETKKARAPNDPNITVIEVKYALVVKKIKEAKDALDNKDYATADKLLKEIQDYVKDIEDLMVVIKKEQESTFWLYVTIAGVVIGALVIGGLIWYMMLPPAGFKPGTGYKPTEKASGLKKLLFKAHVKLLKLKEIVKNLIKKLKGKFGVGKEERPFRYNHKKGWAIK